MKRIVITALLTGVLNGWSQGPFVNLDFESPVLPQPTPPRNTLLPIADALPGWSGYINGHQVSAVRWNNVSIGAADISFHGPGSVYQAFQGSCFVLLQPNYPDGLIVPAIAQSGTVPATARSLTFYAFGSLSVTFADQQIPLAVLGTTPAYSIYGADILAFAGSTGELRFTGGVYLDNIQFSSQPIPEPSVAVLCALGAGLLGWLWLKRTRA